MAIVNPGKREQLYTNGFGAGLTETWRRPCVSAVKKKTYIISGSVNSRVKSSFIVLDIVQ